MGNYNQEKYPGPPRWRLTHESRKRLTLRKAKKRSGLDEASNCMVFSRCDGVFKAPHLQPETHPDSSASGSVVLLASKIPH
ncbi:hypothetical protein RUM44_007278 [Polyplax serrata]|uniref:Uncharacterized protein n=1 Tax=Polyplax serrata TaxID=468196 RepID=A0ABR1B094_POLSC